MIVLAQNPDYKALRIEDMIDLLAVLECDKRHVNYCIVAENYCRKGSCFHSILSLFNPI